MFVFYELWSSRRLRASVCFLVLLFFAVHGLHCQIKQKRERRKWNAYFLGLTFNSGAALFGREFEMIIQNYLSLWMAIEVNHLNLVFNT